MRRFTPVLVSKVCDNPVCGTEVKISDPTANYTPQTVVSYDGYSEGFTYCSNRCVNADYDRSSKLAEDTSHYWAHVMATYEDNERMEAAHLAAFIEDDARALTRVVGTDCTDTDKGADMQTFADHLSKSNTVAQLKFMVSDLGIENKITSRMRKADIVGLIMAEIESDEIMAHEMNKPKGEVQYGTGWNCCKANPVKVIVFDCGTKWAVCQSCANQYPGTVEDLPGETVADIRTRAMAAFDAMVLMRNAAHAKQDKMPVDAPEFELAYQLWLDLHRACDELARTILLIDDAL